MKQFKGVVSMRCLLILVTLSVLIENYKEFYTAGYVCV